MYRLYGGNTMIQDGQLLNYIGGKWKRSRASEYQDVRNPATAETMVRVPLSPPEEVDEAVQAAQAAFPDWRRTPPVQRIQYLFPRYAQRDKTKQASNKETEKALSVR